MGEQKTNHGKVSLDQVEEWMSDDRIRVEIMPNGDIVTQPMTPPPAEPPTKRQPLGGGY